MKLGIIIVCQNNENELNERFYRSYVAQLQEIEVCLVNNNSSDATFDMLNSLSDDCPNVSVVHMKKSKPSLAAVRAGARYMYNEFNLKHVGYVLNFKKMNMQIFFETVYQNKEHILLYNLQLQNSGNSRKSLIRALFSIDDYLEKLQIKFLSAIH